MAVVQIKLIKASKCVSINNFAWLRHYICNNKRLCHTCTVIRLVLLYCLVHNDKHYNEYSTRMVQCCHHRFRRHVMHCSLTMTLQNFYAGELSVIRRMKWKQTSVCQVQIHTVHVFCQIT